MSEEKKEVAQLTPVQTFQNQLKGYEGNIRDLLAIHGMTEREFMVVTLNSIKKVPKLLECDRKTLIAAILTSAELGLPPNTPLGLSYILPYNRKVKVGNQWTHVLEAQWQPGYQGLLEVVLRNPRVESIDSGIVYSNETWVFNKGLRDPFSHTPLPPSKRGEPVGAYAIAWLKDSVKPKVVFLYKEEIDMFKKISQGANSEYSPWNSDEKDPAKWMWRKTCIKQLIKELPKTKEMARAYVHDNVVEMGGSQTVTEEGTVEVIESDFQKNQPKIEQKEAKDANIASTIQDGLFDKNKKES